MIFTRLCNFVGVYLLGRHPKRYGTFSVIVLYSSARYEILCVFAIRMSGVGLSNLTSWGVAISVSVAVVVTSTV